MKSFARAAYQIAAITDTLVVLRDCDTGTSITNNAEAVVASVDQSIPGGLGSRRLFYRDTLGRYDELRVVDGKFAGFAPGSEHQQMFLASLAATVPPRA